MEICIRIVSTATLQFTFMDKIDKKYVLRINKIQNTTKNQQNEVFSFLDFLGVRIFANPN